MEKHTLDPWVRLVNEAIRVAPALSAIPSSVTHAS